MLMKQIIIEAKRHNGLIVVACAKYLSIDFVCNSAFVTTVQQQQQQQQLQQQQQQKHLHFLKKN